MRVYGIIKIVLILVMDFWLMDYILGIEAAVMMITGIMLYAWIGEYIALFKDRAIEANNLSAYEKNRLRRIHEYLIEDVRRVSGVDISGLKLHIIPFDHINAYTYGFKHVAITRSAFNACDDAMLCSVLGHEISHVLNLDAVLKRLVFANVTLVIAGLMIGSFISTSFLWIIFIILCVCGICGGMFSILVFHGISKLLKKIFTMMQYAVLFLYQTIMGFVSRSSEFRADRYSCQLGYGTQLGYFLVRFAGEQASRVNSLNDILYASHPNVNIRISKIEQYNQFG